MGWDSCTPMWLSTWLPLIVAAVGLVAASIFYLTARVVEWWYDRRQTPAPSGDELQEYFNGQWIPVYRDEEGVYHPVGLQLGQSVRVRPKSGDFIGHND